MPIADARNFLSEVMQNTALRDALNEADGEAARQAVLAEAGFRFTADEFEEAWRNELTTCQTEELAGRLHEVNQWWQLLLRFA
jgi:predicted ribosomally synthesized peptide with nif11-like leader